MERKYKKKAVVEEAEEGDDRGGEKRGGHKTAEEADVINGNCAKVPRRIRVTPVPH